MTKRSPIYSGKIHNQRIGYLVGTEAFDLLGNKRCNYNPRTGNLVTPDSGRTVGHVSLAGYFVGSSWISAELFPQPVGENLATSLSGNEALTADSTPSISHEVVEVTSPGAITDNSTASASEKSAPAGRDSSMISLDEAISINSIAEAVPTSVMIESAALMDSSDEATTGSKSTTIEPAASATSPDGVAAAESSGLIDLPEKALTHVPTIPQASSAIAVDLTMSTEASSGWDFAVETPATCPSPERPAADCASCATSSDKYAAAQWTESLLSIDVERQVREMIRMAVAMNPAKPARQDVKDIAARMRERLAGLRKRRQRPELVRMVKLTEMRMIEGRD
jgi:hypothetical protein